MSSLLSVLAAILSLVSRALALVLSRPRSTFEPTVSLPSLLRAASAVSAAASFLLPLILSLTLYLVSTVFSLGLSQASDVFSLVLSQVSAAFSLTLSVVLWSLVVSAALAGRVLHASPSATASAVVASLCMAGPPRRGVVAKPTPAAGSLSGLQQLLRNLFHSRGVDLSLVGFHDVADETADLLEIDDAEAPRTLLHEATQRGDVHAPRKEALAELDLEPALGRLRATTRPQLLVLAQRLLELLAVGADHVHQESVVDP